MMAKGFVLEDPLLTTTSPPLAPLSKYEEEALKAQTALLRGQKASQVAGLKKDKPRAKETYRAARRNASGPDPLKEDFRNFLALIWRALNLPPPSAVQLSLAWWLQHGPARAVILGFRGMAKSWITGAFILWNLYCDPQRKILVISASLDRAVQTVQWCLALIRSVPELQHLQPGPLQRQSGKQFDVGPALPDQSPSLRGAGVTGQITGSRAHLIVPDDVEIPSNSMTVVMREKIAEAVKEFDAILHPGGLVKFLGTPQSEDSLYPKLGPRGYTIRIWPAEYPDKKQRIKYGERLSPFILNRVERDPTLVGHSVWPERFPDEDLASRKLSYGRSGYALQFLLDTSLSDADRYPLKLRDLIVMDLDLERGPAVLAWGTDPKNIVQGLPLLGFEGDKFYGPASTVEIFEPYSVVKAALDPSGRGGDETALSVIAELHGRLFLLYVGAWRDGFSPQTLAAIAQVLVRYRVSYLMVEDNFGDGMFTQLLTPHVIKAWKDHNDRAPQAKHGSTAIEGVRSQRTQKELRILSALEPATQGHRLVVARKVIEDDHKAIMSIDGDEIRHHYSFQHQFTHLTRERDALLHDDRLESVALAVSQFAELLGINPWDSAARKAEEKLDEELERLFGDDWENAPATPGSPLSHGRSSTSRAR
jgi:hypothetical protein